MSSGGGDVNLAPDNDFFVSSGGFDGILFLSPNRYYTDHDEIEKSEYFKGMVKQKKSGLTQADGTRENRA